MLNMDSNWKILTINGIILLFSLNSSSSLALNADDVGCKDAYECCHLDITHDNYNNVYCDGYFSCCASYSIDASESIECTGSHSCYNSTHIYSISEKGVNCNGYKSCGQVNSITIYDGAQNPQNDKTTLVCNGQESCIKTNIYYYGTILRIRGFHAVYDSIIQLYSSKTNNFINATGAMQLYQSKIYFETSGTLRLFGVYSLNSSYIHCQSHQECEIICYDFGCYGQLKTNMVGDGDFKYQCNYNIISNEICESSYSYMDLIINSDNLPVIPSIDPNNNVCLNSNINCENRQECEKSTLTSSNSETICCTASNSCHDSYITVDMSSTSTSGVSDNANTYNVALRCDGSSSCEEAKYIKIIGDGNVYCSGYNSCRASVIKYTDGSGLVNAYCLGEGSCYGAEIAGISNVYCFEYQSCFAGFIIDINTNVYGFGHQSLYEAVIYDMKKVYCLSYQSCRNAKIAQVNELYILGYQGLLQAQLNPQTDNITNNVYCIGYGACWEANLQSTLNIYASGDYSLYNVYISGLRHLKINSDLRGLNLAYIYTGIWEHNFNFNKTVIIDITGTNDEVYNIYCDHNSTCHVVNKLLFVMVNVILIVLIMIDIVHLYIMIIKQIHLILIIIMHKKDCLLCKDN